MSGSYTPPPRPDDPSRPSLFDPPTPPAIDPPRRLAESVRGDDPETSVDAARAVRRRRGRSSRLVLEALVAAGPRGATADEIDIATGGDVPYPSAGKRLGELRDDGYAVMTKVRRPTRRGADAFVHQATDAGIAEVRR